jgi:hypothetical protein
LLVKRFQCVSKLRWRETWGRWGAKRKNESLNAHFCLPVSGKKNKILFKFLS